MRKLIAAINWLSTKINHFVNVVTAALIGLLTVLILSGVFYRYILDNPLPWILPISKILLVWIGLLGISIAFAEAEHVSMKALVYKLPEPFQIFLSVISFGLIFVFLLVVAIKGGFIALASNELIMVSSKIHIPKIWAMMAVPVFALINLLHLLNITEIIKKERAERDRILSMKS
jgi:TRAP-type C4-dicarboxylate transport system permease small subunit